MAKSDHKPDLSAAMVAQEAVALARVLRLLDHAPKHPNAALRTADSELVQWAEHLDAIAREHVTLDTSLPAVDRALQLAEQTTRQMRQEIQSGPLRRLWRQLWHKDVADAVRLTDELVHRLQEQHRMISSQLGR